MDGASILGGCRLLVYTIINQTMVSAMETMFGRKCSRTECMGEDVYLSFWAANGAPEKLKIERATGPWISMASAEWGGCNNEPKVGQNDGISFGEDGTQGNDDWGGCCRIVCATRFWGKNKYNEIRRGYRWPPINDCMQHPTKLTRAPWVGDMSGHSTSGRCRGVIFNCTGGS